MTPDLIVINGHLLTFDKAQPQASAVAVKGGQIIAVGQSADIREMAGPATRIIDVSSPNFLCH